MDASIFIPCSDCSYLCLLELPQTLPCPFPSKVSLFDAGEMGRAHFEGCSGLGLMGFEHLQGWRHKQCSGPCPRAAPLSQGKISTDPLGISRVGLCALEKHPRSPRPSPCRFPSCSLLLPCLWVYPRHLGVWVTPEEEEAARGLITAGEMPLLRARKKVRRARQTVPMASPWQQGLPDMHTGKQAEGAGSITAPPAEPQISTCGALMGSHPKTASKIITAGQRKAPSFHRGRCTAMKPKPGKIHPNQRWVLSREMHHT